VQEQAAQEAAGLVVITVKMVPQEQLILVEVEVGQVTQVLLNQVVLVVQELLFLVI
jgi:hypothetical protein